MLPDGGKEAARAAISPSIYSWVLLAPCLIGMVRSQAHTSCPVVCGVLHAASCMVARTECTAQWQSKNPYTSDQQFRPSTSELAILAKQVVHMARSA